MKRFEDKLAIVTGAASRIGEETGHAFALEGAKAAIAEEATSKAASESLRGLVHA